MSPTDTAVTVSARLFVRRALVFALVAAVLYGGLYAWSERLVFAHAQRNRFFAIRTTPPARYDWVILGASHAAAIDYRDMTARLEAASGSRIMNLAVVGGGVTVNRLLLDYFLKRHRAGGVAYVVDSFAFYGPAWNEARLSDASLLTRAPLDLTLARLLFRAGAPASSVLAYASGFSKINNADRYQPDRRADEGAAFDRRYRPVPQIDRQRLEYLYPAVIDPAALASRARYLGDLERLVADAQSRGMRAVVIRPPLPARVRQRLPGEDSFDAALAAMLARHNVTLYDLSRTNNDEALFYDTDHLNQAGVLRLIDAHLRTILAPVR